MRIFWHAENKLLTMTISRYLWITLQLRRTAKFRSFMACNGFTTYKILPHRISEVEFDAKFACKFDFATPKTEDKSHTWTLTLKMTRGQNALILVVWGCVVWCRVMTFTLEIARVVEVLLCLLLQISRFPISRPGALGWGIYFSDTFSDFK